MKKEDILFKAYAELSVREAFTVIATEQSGRNIIPWDDEEAVKRVLERIMRHYESVVFPENNNSENPDEYLQAFEQRWNFRKQENSSLKTEVFDQRTGIKYTQHVLWNIPA